LDALYWSFLDTTRSVLSDNHRMRFMYSLLDKKDDDELEAMHDRASKVRGRLTVSR
jgi:deoxyribodipyrimidine photolyase-related protein